MSGLRQGDVPAPGGGAPATQTGVSKPEDDAYGSTRGGYGGAQSYVQSHAEDYARQAAQDPAVQRAAMAGAAAAAPAAIREVRSAYDQEYV